MSISNLSAVGYQPQVTSFTAKKYNGPEDFKPGLIMPEKEEKKNKHTVLKTVATLAVVVGAAVLLKKHGKTLWNKLKGLFNKGSKVVGEGAKTAETAGKTIKVNTPAKPAAEVVRNIETSTANSSARKAVEQAIKDTPTKAQQAAYDESIRYVAPTAEQKAAIKANNAVAARETAIAHQIQNAASPESVKALEKAKQGMSEVNTSLNGLFESNGAKLTVKNGKIVKIQTPDGRAITKELNIAKYEHKHGIDLSKLTPASTPKAKPVAPKVPETPAPAPKAETAATPKKTKAQAKAEALKKKQMDAAWKEYTQSKAPSADEILAQRQAELAKLDAKAAKSKDAQVSQAWAEHSPKVETPKAEAPKTKQKLEDLIAQSEADATRIKQQRLQEVEEMIEKQKKEIDAALALKKQQMDEMWAAAGY
ncbi:MAG TPA: hypothetical protein DCS44_07550 [Cyanobacteria bacterium UBA10660]|nr:MAG TPA: hypothetical protein CPT83_02305 [Candidatus Gastranaerophilales bacterium HUM_1]HAS94452.1 hypothetical protein [Cyanobacteria bacterium UBA10660]